MRRATLYYGTHFHGIVAVRPASAVSNGEIDVIVTARKNPTFARGSLVRVKLDQLRFVTGQSGDYVFTRRATIGEIVARF